MSAGQEPGEGHPNRHDRVADRHHHTVPAGCVRPPNPTYDLATLLFGHGNSLRQLKIKSGKHRRICQVLYVAMSQLGSIEQMHRLQAMLRPCHTLSRSLSQLDLI